MGRYDALLATDHLTGDSFLVGDDEEAVARLRSHLATEPQTPMAARVHNLSAADPDEHLAAIQRAMEHIAAGDIYQVNLARAWRAQLQGSPLALWEKMRTASPVPFGLYLDSGEQKVLARTMERFLRWDRKTRELSTRPIKGTIARSGRDDGVEASTLTGDHKERAEHSMIVDLMRNDLSRVAIPGTVAVENPLEVEPYRRLSHLVSTVRCTTQPDKTAADILEATFPPGSVTGAPKERAIEIIEELEPMSRGVYTGALGFLDRAGGLSFAVAIRTAIAREKELVYFAGGGLVEASVPEREVAETELKARVFLDALSTDLGA
jgi:anthranilate/para-aminobenzoate synthase component I